MVRVIPFGEACTTATMLIEMKLREFSLPLDWLANTTPDRLLEMVEADFVDFFPTIDELNRQYRRQIDLKIIFESIEGELNHTNFEPIPIDRTDLFDRFAVQLSTFDITSFEQLYFAYFFRCFSRGVTRKEFCFTNRFGVYSLHDFKMRDFKRGKLRDRRYNDEKAKIDRRVERLLTMMSESKIDGQPIVFVHKALRYFETDQISNTIRLSEALNRRCRAKLVTFNLIPEDRQLSSSIANFATGFNVYTDSVQSYRADASARLREYLRED